MVGLLYSNHVDDKATTMCVKPSMPNKSAGCVSGHSTHHITTNINPNAIQQEGDRRFGESSENTMIMDVNDHITSRQKSKCSTCPRMHNMCTCTWVTAEWVLIFM